MAGISEDITYSIGVGSTGAPGGSPPIIFPAYLYISTSPTSADRE